MRPSHATAAFDHLPHFMGPGPFAVGRSLSLADCTLLPNFALLRRATFPASGIEDPTSGAGRLGPWWQAAAASPLCRSFLEEYDTALDGLLKMLAARSS